MKTRRLKLFRVVFTETRGDGNKTNHELAFLAAENIHAAVAIAQAEAGENRTVDRLEAQGGEVIIAE